MVSSNIWFPILNLMTNSKKHNIKKKQKLKLKLKNIRNLEFMKIEQLSKKSISENQLSQKGMLMSENLED